MQNTHEPVSRWTARQTKGTEQSRKGHKRHDWNNRPQQAEQSLMAWCKMFARESK